MLTIFRGFILSSAMLILSSPAFAEEVTKEQIRGLDEQVQEIKADVLGIAAQMSLLEEKLLYPSDTQVAVFVSLESGAKVRLDSMEIQLDGRAVTHHLYTFKELEALQKGGVQRIYTGNIKSGEHELRILLTGNGSDLRRTERVTFSKDVGPKMLEIRLGGPDAQTITVKDR